MCSQVGAGLQVTPNATRLLTRWKISHRLVKLSSSPKIFTIHRYNDGSILGRRENYGEEMLAKYKSPFWDMHRADLQIALFERAEELGVNFRLGALVTKLDLETPSVTLVSGDRIEGDLVVAADGKNKSSNLLPGKANQEHALLLDAAERSLESHLLPFPPVIWHIVSFCVLRISKTTACERFSKPPGLRCGSAPIATLSAIH